MHRLFSRPPTSAEKLFIVNNLDQELVSKQLHYLVCTRHDNTDQKDEFINLCRLSLFKEAAKLQNEIKEQQQEYIK